MNESIKNPRYNFGELAWTLSKAYSIAFSILSFYHEMEISILDLEDVRGIMLDVENLQFAQVEMLNDLGDSVIAYRHGEVPDGDLAYELERVYDSVHSLGDMTHYKIVEVNKQLDTLMSRNARGLKI